jgi:hypothetical protein
MFLRLKTITHNHSIAQLIVVIRETGKILQGMLTLFTTRLSVAWHVGKHEQILHMTWINAVHATFAQEPEQKADAEAKWGSVNETECEQVL